MKNFTDEEYRKISEVVLSNFRDDENDRSDWMKKTKEALRMAEQTVEEKTFPYNGAANIKLPLILDASIKFASRAYAEIISKDGVVKVKTIGDTPEKQQRAKRVADYMNYQLLCEEEDWETDTDQLLHMLPIVGHMFRKRFFNPAKGRTDSLVISPEKICCSKDGRRKTQIMEMSYSDIVSMQRSDAGWRDIDVLKRFKEKDKLEQTKKCKFTVLEQHCFMDLDEDDYEEPYIIIVEKDSGEVLDIRKRYNEFNVKKNSNEKTYYIEADEYFIDYRFLPDPTGCYYGIGFGQMMGPLTKAANSLINQLVDAGTLNNVQGGFLSDKVEILSGRHQFQLGEWKKIKLSGNEQLATGVMPLPTKEPSPTLFTLLSLLIELNRDLSSIKDVLTGENIGSNVAATTTVALIEQGMKTFNTIYKRIYKSLTKEFKILFKLNGEYLNVEQDYQQDDTEKLVTQEDFKTKGINMIPTADPAMASDMQRLTKAEALKNTIGMPGVNPAPIMENYYRALNVDEKVISVILAPQEPAGPSPEALALIQQTELAQAQLQVEEMRVKIQEREVAIKEREIALKEKNAEVDRMKTAATAVKEIATAEASEKGIQIQQYKAELEKVTNERMANTPNNTESATTDSRRARPTIGDSGIY